MRKRARHSTSAERQALAALFEIHCPCCVREQLFSLLTRSSGQPGEIIEAWCRTHHATVIYVFLPLRRAEEPGTDLDVVD